MLASCVFFASNVGCSMTFVGPCGPKFFVFGLLVSRKLVSMTDVLPRRSEVFNDRRAALAFGGFDVGPSVCGGFVFDLFPAVRTGAFRADFVASGFQEGAFSMASYRSFRGSKGTLGPCRAVCLWRVGLESCWGSAVSHPYGSFSCRCCRFQEGAFSMASYRSFRGSKGTLGPCRAVGLWRVGLEPCWGSAVSHPYGSFSPIDQVSLFFVEFFKFYRRNKI